MGSFGGVGGSLDIAMDDLLDLRNWLKRKRMRAAGRNHESTVVKTCMVCWFYFWLALC